MSDVAVSNSVKAEAIFGSADGFCTAIGIIAGSRHLAFGLVFAVALAGALSMAWGQFISENGSGWREAVAMGVATLVGTAAPCLPVLLIGGPLGIACTVLLGIALAVVVGRARDGKWGWLISLGGFLVVAVPTVIVGVLTAGG